MIDIENSLDFLEVSIIIPIYKQWDKLPILIKALAEQDYPLQKNGEVLLIDNDPTSDFNRPLFPAWVKLISCHEPGSYAARNMGSKYAKGKLLVFTDADCRPHPCWLSALIHAHKGQYGGKSWLLAGPVNIPLLSSASIWQTFDAVRGIPQKNFIARGYAATANLAVPLSVFQKLSGFDPKRLSGGDAEFCRRAGRLGFFIRFVPQAAVDHSPRDGFKALELKARRIKGGQITSGSLINRIFWFVRSLSPPIREIITYLKSEHDIYSRLTASAVRLMLWGVELHEIVRLVLYRLPPERR